MPLDSGETETVSTFQDLLESGYRLFFLRMFTSANKSQVNGPGLAMVVFLIDVFRIFFLKWKTCYVPVSHYYFPSGNTPSSSPANCFWTPSGIN